MSETTFHGPTLLSIARASLAEALGLAAPAWDDAAWLAEPHATFVTLRQDDELRGCIGTLVAHRALRDDVAENALAAGFRDPRFPRLAAAELAVTRIEVSVLTPPRPLPVASEDEALRKLRPGVDGVIFGAGPYRSTFLPQVWDEVPDPAEFLAHLKLKAGLPARGWPRGTTLQIYQVTKFTEAA